RQHTNAGAEAFVRYYNDQLSKAWMTPQTGLLPPLSLSTCKSCRAWEKSAELFNVENTRMRGVVFAIEDVSVWEESINGFVVRMAGPQNANSIVDDSGRVIKDVSASPGHLYFSLVWVDGQWKVEEIQAG
ncbi:MAG: hypothetical protein ACK5MP_01180, partial [Nostocoides sp.]